MTPRFFFNNIIRNNAGHRKGREFPRVGNMTPHPLLLPAAATAARQQRPMWPKFGHVSKKTHYSCIGDNEGNGLETTLPLPQISSNDPRSTKYSIPVTTCDDGILFRGLFTSKGKIKGSL